MLGINIDKFGKFRANKSLAEFSTANSSLADVVSEDDVCRAFCIPPIYTKNFDEKHFFLNKFKYFRSLFLSKNYPES